MTAVAPDDDHELLRLLSVTARLYHVHRLRQRDIALRLGISQARVSRLLRQCEDRGIVRTAVVLPDGLHADLEDEIERRFPVCEVHVVDVAPSEDVAGTLGRAAARYLHEAGLAVGVIGFTSWSTTLQEMAHAMPASSRVGSRCVVEMLGDLGSPTHQHAAARATQALARAMGAEAVFLRTPGVVATMEQRDAAWGDAHVARALSLLDRVDLAFVGVGPAEVHSVLEAGDRYFTPDQLADSRAAGAVSQLNQRFIDDRGGFVVTPLDDLVVGVGLEQLRHASRRVVVAGGPEKHRSVRAALVGGWVDLLITDPVTARAVAA